MGEVVQRKWLLEAVRNFDDASRALVECRIFVTRDFRTVLTYVGMCECGADVLFFEERPTKCLPESSKRPQIWPAVDLPDPDDVDPTCEFYSLRIHLDDDNANQMPSDSI